MEGGVVRAVSVRAVREGLRADFRADAAFQLDGDLLGDWWSVGWMAGNSRAVARDEPKSAAADEIGRRGDQP